MIDYLTLIGFTVPQTFDQLMDLGDRDGFIADILFQARHGTDTRAALSGKNLPEHMDALVRTMASTSAYDWRRSHKGLMPTRKDDQRQPKAARLLRQTVVVQMIRR